MTVVKKNIIANILGKGWGMMSIFLFIPIYIEILGIESYGVVSFYAVLQGLLLFADAGLTATLRRELAKGDNSICNRKAKFKILKSIEFVYGFILLSIFSLIFFSADFIVNDWLIVENLDRHSVKKGVQFMSVALSLNFLSTLYQGGILGLEKQVASNVFYIAWGVIKGGGVILALLFINNSVEVFFLWQLGVNFIYVLGLRFFLMRILRKSNSFHWNLKRDFNVLKPLWKYAFGMLIISLIAALNMQLDKLVLSKVLSISDLAVYSVAYSLSLIPVALSGPIAIAIFPKFVKLVERKNEQDLLITFNNAFKIVLLITASCGIVVFLNSELLLTIWTSNSVISQKAAIACSLLVAGQLLLSLQVIPFNLALANGYTKINVIMGLIGLAFLVPMVIVLTNTFGLDGAAFSWFCYSLIFTPIYILIVVKKFLSIKVYPWVFNELLKPITLIILGNLGFYFLMNLIDMNFLGKTVYLVLTSFLVLLFTFKKAFNLKHNNIYNFIKNELFT